MEIHKLIIEEGAFICKRLKSIYPEKDWMEISEMFTKLKKATRKFYPNLKDFDMLIQLHSYTNQDLMEALA